MQYTRPNDNNVHVYKSDKVQFHTGGVESFEYNL